MSTSKPTNKITTASDFTERLRHDSDYQTRLRQVESRRQESNEHQRLVTAPILHDLRNAGFVVESLDELRHSGTDYKAAIPLLLRWLPLVTETTVKDSIIRALSIPNATQAALPIIKEFKATTGPVSNLKWTIANALAVIANDSVFKEIAELVRDKRNGKSREMFAVALGNMQNPAAVDLLMELLDDDEIAGHALIGLQKLKAKRARPLIERFLKHPKAWVRKEASKALASLER